MRKQICGKDLLVLVIPVFILAVCFFLFFTSKASANSGNTDTISGYESVLIRDGDTLSTIAGEYASALSHMTSGEYLNSIKKLNDMKSEHITAGDYLLLPVYK